MNIQKILNEVSDTHSIRLALKVKSPLWPRFIREETGNRVYLSSIVRFQYDGKWWLTHHLHSCTSTSGHKSLSDMVEEVYLIINLAQPDSCQLDQYGLPLWEVDPIQISETERISIKVKDNTFYSI